MSFDFLAGAGAADPEAEFEHAGLLEGGGLAAGGEELFDAVGGGELDEVGLAAEGDQGAAPAGGGGGVVGEEGVWVGYDGWFGHGGIGVGGRGC